MTRPGTVLPRLLAIVCLALVVVFAGVWVRAGRYGVDTLLRHGGTYWVPVATDSRWISPSMRLALRDAPAAMAGPLQWRMIAPGFETADLPVLAEGQRVDDILLARIDPARFRFVALNDSTGRKNLDQWMTALGAALVVNGSYYAKPGTPDTPFLSNGVLLGPRDYQAAAGAFVSAPGSTGIVNLAHEDWRTALQGAENAMVSYPLLVADGTNGVHHPSRWLANRSFVGQDSAGRLIIGTTADGFFSLQRLGDFLPKAPLGLTIALNLDGGPVACQGISLNGYERRSYGKWELQVHGDRAKLLTKLYGTWAMPMVLAVFPR